MKKSRDSRQSEADMDAMVVAEAEDDQAWDAPEIVPRSSAPTPGWMSEGQHLELAASGDYESEQKKKTRRR